MNPSTSVVFNPIINSGSYSGVGAFYLNKTIFEMAYNTQDGAYDVFTRNSINSWSNATGLGGLTSPETADAGKIATGFQDSTVYKFANLPCFTRDILFSGVGGTGTVSSSRIFFGIDTGLYLQAANTVWYRSPDGGVTWADSSADIALPVRRLR